MPDANANQELKDQSMPARMIQILLDNSIIQYQQVNQPMVDELRENML